MNNKFMKLYIRIYLLITLIYNIASINDNEITNIIVIPFKTFKPDSSSPINVTSLFKNDIFIELNVTTQTLIATFNSEQYQFYMTSKDCPKNSNYIIQKSPYFQNISMNYCSERFILYRDYDLKKFQYGLFANMKFEEYNSKKQCAVFGLKMKPRYYDYQTSSNFIETYKSNGNINSTKWTMKYINNDEGLLIMGDSPINYDPVFINNKYKEYQTNAITYSESVFFGINFDNVFTDKNNIEGSTSALFYHELNALLVTKNFFEKMIDIFFEKYMTLNICQRGWEPFKYVYIYCNSEFSQSMQKSFPNIYFKSVNMEYTFELTQEDLFSKQKDGNTYFLIAQDISENKNEALKIGKPFLKKYALTADNANTKVSLFLLDKEVKKENTQIIFIIILSVIVVILAGLLSFFIFKVIKNKKTKRRANELDEDYEYLSKEKRKVDDDNGLSNLGI